MPDEPLQRILEEMRSRIQAELDGQVQAIRTREAETISAARQEAEAEADRRWSARVEAVRSEWSARLESEVAAARAEAEKRFLAEAMRIRDEADQAIAAEQTRAAELDVALADERKRKTSGIEAGGALRAMRAMDAARSLSDILTSVARGAASHAPRAALFVVNGQRLEEWTAPGTEPLSRQPVEVTHAGLLRAAIARGGRVSAPADASAPSFAQLPEGRAAVAVPLTIDGQPVAVLYADESESGERAERPGWTDIVELLARYGAACLGQLTATRSLQLLNGGSGKHTAPATPQDEEQSARRYAKLLVSEIKLYNEGAVRVGRERRDLSRRLKAEIERARRLYEERVSPNVTARTSYFQQELIQTLAGGDPALLGS